MIGIRWVTVVKLICGVGKYDGDYAVTKSEKINGKWRTVWTCKFYTLWRNMIIRCYHTTHQGVSYKGCTVCKEWHTFSVFYAWAKDKYKEGLYLDKDLLVEGNREYSPENCIFVDRRVNNFLTDRNNHRGRYPLGVHKKKCKLDRYVAQCSNPFGNTSAERRGFIGHFDTPEEAHLAWKAKKHEYACMLADLQENTVVAEALRNRFK